MFGHSLELLGHWPIRASPHHHVKMGSTRDLTPPSITMKIVNNDVIFFNLDALSKGICLGLPPLGVVKNKILEIH